MIAGDAPVASVPVSDALHVTPAAAAGVFTAIVVSGNVGPGMQLAGNGGGLAGA